MLLQPSQITKLRLPKMPANYRDERPRRRDDDSRDEIRDRKQRRSRSLSSDNDRYRRRDEGRDHSNRHRRDRSPEDSRRRRDRDDDRSHRRRTSRDRSRQRRRSRSPDSKRRRDSKSQSPPPTKSRGPLPSQNDQFRGEVANEGGEPLPEKQKPNWKPTGLLAKEANTVAGTSTVLKYHEPAEARKPPTKEQWRMYVFKKKDLLDTVQLYQRSCWLAGRDKHVTDLTLEHPSISKQHAG